MGGADQAHQTRAHVPSGVDDGPCKKKKPMWIDPLVVGQVHKSSALSIWSSRKDTDNKEESGRAHLWVGPVHQSRFGMVRVRRRKKVP